MGFDEIISMIDTETEMRNRRVHLEVIRVEFRIYDPTFSTSALPVSDSSVAVDQEG